MRYGLYVLIAVSCGLSETLSCVRDGGLAPRASQKKENARLTENLTRDANVGAWRPGVHGVQIPKLAGSYTAGDWRYEVTCEPSPSAYEPYGISLSYKGRKLSGKPGDVVSTPWGLLKCNRRSKWVNLHWYMGLTANDFKGKRDLTPCSKDAIPPAQHPNEDDIINDCIRILREHRKNECPRAIAVIHGMGAKGVPAVPHLISVLKKEYDLSLVYPSHSPSSVPIVECLGFIGTGAKEAVPTLMKYVDHPDVNLRSRLVWALFRIAPDFDGTRAYIRKAAQDKSERVKAAGQSALKELRRHDDAKKSDAGGPGVHRGA